MALHHSLGAGAHIRTLIACFMALPCTLGTGALIRIFVNRVIYLEIMKPPSRFGAICAFYDTKV